MALSDLLHAVSKLLPDSLHSGVPEWARQPLHEYGIPDWIGIAIAVAAIIPVLYLLMRDTKAKVFLKSTEFQDLPLDHIEVISHNVRRLTLLQKKTIFRLQVVSHNVRRFRFALPDKRMVIGLPIGSHITIAAKDTEGKDVMRPYTPVTDDSSKGHVDFVIKLYPQGKMSQCMSRLSLGDTLRFKGPRGRFKYQPNMKKAIGMIAGGSGVTPMFQVAQGILRDPRDVTQVFLIYANVTKEDILLRKELDAWAHDHTARFKVYYVLNNPPAEWKGGVGYVSKEIVREHLPLPSEDVITLRCGPPPMNRAVEAILDDSGFTKEMQFEF